MKIALVGNQNSGKTTLFNKLTNMSKHVGNFPGVTVDIAQGICQGHQIIDLPGLYSLSTYSEDENVTKEFLYNNTPDVIINVVDCMKLQRSLNLTLQLKETGIPIVIALNMVDEIYKNNGTIDIKKIENTINIPIVALTNINQTEIIKLINKTIQIKRNFKLKKFEDKNHFELIDKLYKEAVNIPVNKRVVKSYKIDKILTNKYLGIPIFIFVMYLIFKLTFDTIGNNLSEILENGINIVSNWILIYLEKINCSIVIKSLIIEGILKGIGAVLSFLPIIVVLYFCLSILEDSGYMTRIAFIVDRIFQKIGLSGRAIVPILLGFGCSVPAILSIRTIETEKERNLALNLVPFISCSAKIPIYAIFVKIFFKKYQALAMLSIYLIGIFLGISSLLLIKLMSKNKSDNMFLLELPNYRIPSLKNTCHLMWNKVTEFLQKSFTVIFFTSIIIWFLKSFDKNLLWVSEKESILAMLSQKIIPIFNPLGFKNWRIVTALITGISAKESILSTLSILSTTNIEIIIYEIFTLASSISFITFTLLYTPCIATLGVIKKEFGTKKAIKIGIYQFFIAYLISYILYNLFTIC